MRKFLISMLVAISVLPSFSAYAGDYVAEQRYWQQKYNNDRRDFQACQKVMEYRRLYGQRTERCGNDDDFGFQQFNRQPAFRGYSNGNGGANDVISRLAAGVIVGGAAVVFDKMLNSSDNEEVHYIEEDYRPSRRCTPKIRTSCSEQ